MLKTKGDFDMKVAIPTAEGQLAMHFGHCEKFAIIEVEENKIVKTEEAIPPPHEPGVLPKWLGEMNVDLIIAGGMGVSAQDLFKANGVKVLVGAPAEDVKTLVESYLNGSLVTGQNVCDH
jgi:predicted Fe-Mo cluster-binding NifX family protein